MNESAVFGNRKSGGRATSFDNLQSSGKSSEMVKELVFLRVKLLRKPNGKCSGNQ